MGDSRGAYKVLVVGPEGKKTLGKSRHRWWNNIKLYLNKWNVVMVRIDMTQDRDRLLTCEYGNELFGSIKCREFLN